MQIKTTMRYYFGLIRIAIVYICIKKIITSIVKDVEKLESLYIAVGNVKWYSCYG